MGQHFLIGAGAGARAGVPEIMAVWRTELFELEFKFHLVKQFEFEFELMLGCSFET